MYINEKSYSAKFICRQSTIIALQVIIKRKKFEWSSGIKWPQEFFNKRQGFIEPRYDKDPDFLGHSKALWQMLLKAEGILERVSSVKEFKASFCESETYQYLKDFAISFIDGKNCSESSRKAYHCWARKAYLISNPKLSEVDLNWIQSLDESMVREGMKRNSIACTHVILDMAFKKAASKGAISWNPYESFKINYEDMDDKVLSPKSLKALFQMWENKDLLIGRQYEAVRLFMIGLRTGLRISDLQTVSEDDVFDMTLIKKMKKSRKGKKVRVPISNTTLDLIKSKKRDYSDTTINRAMRELSEELGQKITMHMARHHFASTIAELSKNPYIVQEALGHESIDMSLTYVHTADGKFRSLITELDLTYNEINS